MPPENNSAPPADDASFGSMFSDAGKSASLPPDTSSSSPPPSSQPAASTSQAAPSQPVSPPPAAPLIQQPAVQPNSSAQAVPQTPNPLFAQAQQLGFTGQPTEGELAKWAFERMQGQQQYVQFAQQVIPYQDKFQEFLASQQQLSAPVEQPVEEGFQYDKYMADRWKVPERDKQCEQWVKDGVLVMDPQTRNYIPAPGYEVLAGQGLREYNAGIHAEAEHIQDLFRNNPYKKFHEETREARNHEVREIIREELNGTLGQRDVTNQIQSYEQTNAGWLFQVNPTTGQPEHSAQGFQFISAVRSLMEQGIQDPFQAISFAEKLVGVNRQQSGSSQPLLQQTSPAMPAVQQPPVPQAPQQVQPDPRETFMKNAAAKAGHSSNSGGAPASAPDAFNIGSEAELTNMFSRAHLASAGQR